MKTRHPQLQYESKIYMFLQGGSEFGLSFSASLYEVLVPSL